MKRPAKATENHNVKESIPVILAVVALGVSD
jgi:hypothetical protein